MPQLTLRGSWLSVSLSPSCASASPRLHGVAHDMPSPMAGFAFQSYNEFRTEVKTDFPDAINVGDIPSIETEETVRV